MYQGEPLSAKMTPYVCIATHTTRAYLDRVLQSNELRGNGVAACARH
jgi:hypothetical protein